jgi:hypothetical protein
MLQPSMEKGRNMDMSDRGRLERFVRDYHVHYDLETERVVREDRSGADRDEVVGFDIRLLATHDDSLKEPGCRKCTQLLAELTAFAEELLSSGDARSFTEIVPEEGALYVSNEVRDADEVAVVLRVRREEGEHRSEGASHDRRLVGVRELLRAVGVHEHT